LRERHRLTRKDALLAYAVGFAVEAKLGCWVNMVHYEKGWHLTATLGTFDATAAAGELLSRNARQLPFTFGIAGSEASGSKEISAR
jgi:2-methylcitrate dehydratase PrpD